MNVGGGSQESSSQSTSRVGLRGTRYEGEAADQTVGQGRQLSRISDTLINPTLERDPQSYFNFGASMLPGGKYGLGLNADKAVEEFGTMMHGKASGDYGARGFLSPENRGAITGSAIQKSLPFLIPQIQQMQMAQFMAPQSLMQTAKTSADFWNRALGAQSDASSSSSGWNFGFGVGGSTDGKGGGSGLGMFMV